MKVLDPALKLKRYLGDGVYAGFDGFQLWLWTERNGQMHEVALDPEVIINFNIYWGDVSKSFTKNEPLKEQI